ncbi:MAG TPA: FAD-dependent oxidoreductase [Steroidobacteraceae bacterium]|nr:FAD-dependent oxidoreductase [Steroidobacteraceae bacterium]
MSPAPSDRSLPRQARVVIIGGGMAGCSIAYHLAKLGWTDVVLLERAQLTSGTTWHAAGLLTTLRDTETQTRLAAYSQQLFRRLEEETGQATGLIECGSIQLALTAAKAEEMRRGYRAAQSWGIECREIDAAEVQRMWPLAYVGDVQTAFHFPNDGRINPTDVTRALAKGARRAGVAMFENCPVLGVERQGGRVRGIESALGPISTGIVVNCAGMWARQVGRLAGVDVPLQAAEHYYLISEPVAGVHPKLPILRDPGRSTYIREEAGKLMVGIFEDAARPWKVAGIPPDFTFGEIPPDWDRLQPHLERACERVPVLAQTGVKLLFCGPESFTADHNYLMGEAPDLKGFFVAAGFNSLGILSGGGVGFVMAHWIANGGAPMDVWSVNIRRTHAWQNNPRYLADRVVESLGIGYQDHWPFRQWSTARGVKRSILHERLAAAGACFGESAGWERPNWYARPGQKPVYEYGWGRQNWFENSAEEHRAVREAVGLFEQTSFAKILVQGRDAEAALNRIATADCRVAVGKIVYTQFLNERGGIEADLSVTRLAAERFLVVTAAFTATHVIAWLREHIDAQCHCLVTDVSDAWCMLNVQGPRSRELLSALASGDWSNAGFPFGTAREVQIGYGQALALRITYMGELGWELYVPVPFAMGVYDAIVEAGAPLGLRHCGYHALNSLRIEKAYRDWSHDIGPDDTPLDAGLAFTCAWEKPGGFIGREALLALRYQPRRRRLVQFLLRDSDAMLYHNEPILLNGERVGLITSGMFAHSLGAAAGLGYVRDERGVSAELIASARFEILIGDRTVPARATLKPFYDPTAVRPRS